MFYRVTERTNFVKLKLCTNVLTQVKDALDKVGTWKVADGCGEKCKVGASTCHPPVRHLLGASIIPGPADQTGRSIKLTFPLCDVLPLYLMDGCACRWIATWLVGINHVIWPLPLSLVSWLLETDEAGALPSTWSVQIRRPINAFLSSVAKFHEKL